MGELGIAPKNSRIFKTVVFSGILLFIMLVGSAILGVGKGGFSLPNLFTQFTFYFQYGIASVVIILLFTFGNKLITKGDGRYGEGLGYFSPGEKPHYQSKIFNKAINLFFASLIIFSILGLVAGVTQQTFFGVGRLQQQFTKLDNSIFNALVVVPSENLGYAAVLAVVLFGIGYYARKKNLSENAHMAYSYLLGITAAVAYGVVLHLARYGAQDESLLNVAAVWGFGGLITMVIGSAIPFLVMHAVNNVFYDLGRNFSNDTVLFGVIVFIVLVSALFIYLLYKRKRSV